MTLITKLRMKFRNKPTLLEGRRFFCLFFLWYFSYKIQNKGNIRIRWCGTVVNETIQYSTWICWWPLSGNLCFLLLGRVVCLFQNWHNLCFHFQFQERICRALYAIWQWAKHKTVIQAMKFDSIWHINDD